MMKSYQFLKVLKPSSVSATVGTAVNLGISKVNPVLGKVALEIESINPRSAEDNGLITSVDCGVGINAGFVLEESSAAFTY
jgi:hypothetical protein